MQKILLIDDDKWVTDLYGDKLKEEGFKVFVAHNGKRGIELARKNKPDIILSDLVMSNGDGFYVLEKIREYEETKDIPVINLTNISNPVDKKTCIEMGACSYFLKSEHTPSQVVKKIKTLLKEIL